MPLVAEMLSSLDTELKRYERVVRYWRVFGPRLERTASDVIRCTVTSISNQCGMVRRNNDSEVGEELGLDVCRDSAQAAFQSVCRSPKHLIR